MANVSDKIFDTALRNHISILRLAEAEKMKAEQLLIQLRKKLISEITSKDPLSVKRTEFQKQRMKDLFKSVDEIVKGNFQDLSVSSKKALLDMAEYEAGATVAMVDGAIGIQVMAPELSIDRIKSLINNSMVDGELMGKWWTNKGKEFTKEFRKTMNVITKKFQARMMKGQALGQMLSAVSSDGALMSYTRRNVEAMIRTSFVQVSSEIRQATYDQNKDILKGMRWLSTLDTRTTPICMALDGRMWDMKRKPIGHKFKYRRPPAHWQCRSTIVPVTLPYSKMVKHRPKLKNLNSKQRSSMDGPVSKDLDYGDWFKTLDQETQIDILGKTKYSLWKKGSLSMSDMVKQNGNPLTIKELKKKVG